MRSALKLLLIPVLLYVSASCFAAPILDGSHVKEFTLDNGLRAIVKEEPGAPVVALTLMIRVAPLYETAETAGASHFVEHLLFEADMGANDRKLGPFVEGLGGQINAATSRDSTTVTVTVTPDSVDAVLAMLAKAAFEAKFTDNQVAEQRSIIKREIADRMISVDDALDRGIWGLAFNSHPYRRPIGGDNEAVGRLTTEGLQAFYNKFYVPNNMAIIACGSLKADAFQQTCQRYFGQYFRKSLNLTLPAPEPTQTSPRIRIEPRTNDATIFAYAFHAPPMANKRDVCAMDLIYALLGEGEQSILKRKLETEKQLVKGTSVDFITHKMSGLLVISAVADPKQELPARQAVLDAISSLAAQKVSDTDLARAKKLIYVSYAFQNEACADQVGSMSFYEAIDSYKFAIDYIDEVNRVTSDDILRVAQACLRPEAYSLLVMRAQKPAAPGQEARLP